MSKLSVQPSRRVLAGVLLVVVVLIGIVVASRVEYNNGYNRLSAAQKIESVTSDLRAPGDPSVVANSTFGTAFQIRSEVASDVTQGLSKNQILQAMVKEYGSTVLAVPRFIGFGILTWIVPILIAFGILTGVLRFVTRSAGQRPVSKESGDSGIHKVPSTTTGTTQGGSKDEAKLVTGQLQEYL